VSYADDLAKAREERVVVGVDAALAKTGWSIVTEQGVTATGVIRTKPKDSEPYRLWRLWSEFGELLRRYRTNRTVVAIERPGGWVRGKAKTSLRTIEVLAAGRAAVKIMAVWQDCTAVDLDVNEARRLILGVARPTVSGRRKDWVLRLVKMRFGLEVSDDEADAVVVGTAGLALWKAHDPRFPSSE
jgi:Holliday junction resolvasome RuvABC endonuclease subunit